MKKKTTEISINTSSGAEKVETIEKQIQEGEQVKKTVKSSTESAKGAAAMGGARTEKRAEKKPNGKTSKEKVAAKIKKENAASAGSKAEKESLAAKARVDAALKRKEAQEKRKEERKARAAKKAELRKRKQAEKKAIIEKRAAEKKAKAEKHAAERKALAEKRAAAKEEKLRQRARAKANRNNANYNKKKAKSAQKQSRSENRAHRDGRNKGYGGWIAAVVSLGVVSLALATTVTVGAIEMNKGNESMMNAQRGTVYELTGIMDNVDADLDRVRISNSPAQQSRILTDLLVQTRLAELDLEKLPIDGESSRNVTSFINRTAAECERMLGKLRRGETLSTRDGEILEKLYATNHSVRTELDKLTETMTDKDMMGFMKKGVGSVKEAIERIEKATLTENGDLLSGKPTPLPAPPIEKEERPHVEAATAEALCSQYFEGYHIDEFQCIGETATKGYNAYNVQGYDGKGNQLFAEVSQADGKLLRFDYYEDCSGEKFDVDRAEDIAEEFLEMLGYEDVEAVRLRANGSTTDFTFVYEKDGVAYYPDEIRVKVCRTRGLVSGFDATKYLQSHGGRDELKVNFTLAEAQNKLHEGLRVESSRLAVIATERGERTAYEFLCNYGEESYFVFVDAVSGEEISIVNVKDVL